MIHVHASYRARMVRVTWLLAVLCLVLLLVWLVPTPQAARGIAGYVPLHTLMETAAIVVSTLVFAVGWAVYSRNRPTNLLLLACVFLGVALLDFLHTISYAGMPEFVTPSGPEKAIFFWLSARILSAAGLLAVALLPRRAVQNSALRRIGLVGILALVAFLAWVGLFHQDWLPRTFIEGQGLTILKIVVEFALVAIFLLTAFLFLRKMRTVQAYDVVGLFGAVATMALSELFFTLYANVTDLFNLLGHVYKVIAYGFVYRSIFVDNVRLPYQRLNDSNARLEQEIAERKQAQNQLERIAHFDTLTGLPNRVLLGDRLQQAMAQCQRSGTVLAVAYLDLDGFKQVNDQYGPDTGDQFLLVLSQRMNAALREGDTLARLGGDEFVILLGDVGDLQGCETLLHQLLHTVAMPVQLGDKVLQLSASIGVTLFPQDNVGGDQLLRHADQSMYQAKQAGKHCFHLFDVVQDAAVQSQRESLARLREALELGQFVLYYQPKVNMRTGAVVGAEALIRWQHPERGLLPPGAFLPAMENDLLSVAVGEWVITTALEQMAQWRREGLPLDVSVNVGALQMQQSSFVDRLVELLAEHPEVSAQSLELEILETSALEDMTQISKVMRACQSIGVRFALDDFGTGYSSLTYLKRLPAQMLKIDQSFVRDMLMDVDDLAIVKGVIGLAAAFRRDVIAEGVETAAHGQMLLAIGCELAQGYGIARPMPAKEMAHWAAHWRPDASWSKPA